MPLIEWMDDLSVNVKELDDEHKKLISLINELHDAMRERKTKETLKKIIDGLISYTGTHFAHEEKYFVQFNYNKTLVHKKLHKDFVTKVLEFKKGFEEDRMMLSMDIMNFLKDWLTMHIKGSDKEYSALFNENGIV